MKIQQKFFAVNDVGTYYKLFDVGLGKLLLS